MKLRGKKRLLRHNIFHRSKWGEIDWLVVWANWRIYRGNASSFLQEIKLPYELVMWFILYGGIIKLAYGVDVTPYIWQFAIGGSVVYVVTHWIIGQFHILLKLESNTSKAHRKHRDPEVEEHLRLTREIREILQKLRSKDL